MNLFWCAIKYVMSDLYFVPSMAVTVMVGIFIGSVIYDGILVEVKKAMLAIASYSLLITMTSMARITPKIPTATDTTSPQFFAGVVTILLVTLFYLFGMWLGVRVTNRAHKNDTKRICK
jgi:hypothetical protein